MAVNLVKKTKQKKHAYEVNWSCDCEYEWLYVALQ